MGGNIMRFAHNVDAIVPLILGVAVSVLGLFDVASPHVTDNSILIVLAVLSFALLRDRWRKDSSERDAKETSAAALSKLRAIEREISPIATLNQVAERMRVSIEGLTTIRTIRGADIDRAHEEARVHTDRWMFKGGTGTYTRAMTLPLCIQSARNEHRALQVQLEVLDPTNEALCDRYARYRVSLSSGPDGTGEPWTTDRTRKESFATLLAALWYQQRFQLLDIKVGLASTMSAFRYDLSASRIIITQDDPRFPAMMISSSSPLYESYVAELRLSLSQTKRVPLEGTSVILDEPPTEAQAREFFISIGLPLPDHYEDEDARQIIRKAISAKNPYGLASYDIAAKPSALESAPETDGN
jgi:hypothetical protein